jgi:phospholipid/cholesterol/gamma-HCH transport system permease protein
MGRGRQALTTPVHGLGFSALRWVEHLGRFGGHCLGILRALVTPPIRVRPFVDELYKLGVLSLVIIAVCGVAVGMVLGLQGYNTLVRFGATDSLGAVVGLGLIRELGPVLTALLVTGRAGSATTAEIATMVTTEQMDGLRMMSIDPVQFVLTPRALGMIAVMPALSALFITCGLFGGYLVAAVIMHGDGGLFVSSVQDAVVFADDVVGSFLKAFVFGVLVAMIATYRGYTAEPTSAGVSAATTSTVVISSVSILLSDYVITALWGI